MIHPLPSHEPSIAIDAAVRWLTDTPRDQRPGAVVPQLRERFGLSTTDAINALRDYNAKLARAA
jgi:hypothetical protein